MLIISADTYLNIALNMNQAHVLFTCISAGKTSRGAFTHQTSPSHSHQCFLFQSHSFPVMIWFLSPLLPFYTVFLSFCFRFQRHDCLSFIVIRLNPDRCIQLITHAYDLKSVGRFHNYTTQVS